MIVTVLGEPVRGTSLLINSGYSSGIAIGGSNSGTGFGLYQSTTNGILSFKSLTAGTGVTLTNNTNDINIAVPSSYITGIVNSGYITGIVNSSYITGIITPSYINTNATAKVSKAGDSMTGALAMGGNKVTGLAAASANGDAVRFEQLPTLGTPTTSGLVKLYTDLAASNTDGSVTQQALVNLVSLKARSAWLSTGMTLGSGVSNVSFEYKKEDDVLKIRGVISIPNINLTSGTTILTLPVGFRPSRLYSFISITTSPNGLATEFIRCFVNTNGDIRVYEPVVEQIIFEGFYSFDIAPWME